MRKSHIAFCAWALTALVATTGLAEPSALVKTKISEKSSSSKLVPPSVAGIPADQMPGAKLISSKDMAAMKEPLASGLYILDSEGAVPAGLDRKLKAAGLTLTPNGAVIDAKGKEKAVFVHSETYQLAGGGKQGSLPFTIERFAKNFGDAIIPSAEAADPYPFRCLTLDLFAVYERGFCRYTQVHTYAEANGLDGAGACGPARPATRISSIQVRAGFLPSSISRRSCTNCSERSVMREIHHGCFWPAIGGVPTKRHQVNMIDLADGARFDGVWDW